MHHPLFAPKRPNLIAGDITGLRGVDLGVRDVASLVRFYTDVWRLAVTAERNGSVYLRGSGAYCHILALHPRSEPALLCVNLPAADRSAVDRLHARVTAAGAPQVGPAAPIDGPGGVDTASCSWIPMAVLCA